MPLLPPLGSGTEYNNNHKKEDKLKTHYDQVTDIRNWYKLEVYI